MNERPVSFEDLLQSPIYPGFEEFLYELYNQVLPVAGPIRETSEISREEFQRVYRNPAALIYCTVMVYTEMIPLLRDRGRSEEGDILNEIVTSLIEAEGGAIFVRGMRFVTRRILERYPAIISQNPLAIYIADLLASWQSQHGLQAAHA